MRLVIKKIILYPRDIELRPRVIEFNEKKVNVITGYSQRGKSAIISIIDYCLGSRDCNIPIGKIRTNVDKFALIIGLDNINVFIARDCPSENIKSTEVMYFETFSESEVMTFSLDKWIAEGDNFKTIRKTVVNFFSAHSGFENISEKDDNSIINGFDSPASFRDTTAFQFQPQNIIANPTTIFYNTDTFEHLKRLKTIFPLILGYKSYDILNLEKEIDTVEKELKELQSKYDDIVYMYENWEKDIYKHYSKAIILGLTNSNINLESAKNEQIISELRTIKNNVGNNKFFKEGASLRYANKLQEFENQRILLMRALNELKADLINIERFDISKDEYLKNVSFEIQNRLKPIDWFINQHGTDECPFCNSKSNKAIEQLLSLNEEKELNNKTIQDSNSKDFSFEKEKNILRTKISKIERQLTDIDTQIDILINENKEEHQKHQDIYEFIGRIDEVLENLDKISPSSILVKNIEKKSIDILRKKRALQRLKDKFDKEASLNKVTEHIGHYLKILPIEDKNNRKVLLDPDNSVSIKIEDTQSRNITFLSKLGSGANHMCYHLATLLGLHEYFLELPLEDKKNYIPSFLVLDQPSQVYYPEDFSEIENVNQQKKIKISEDIKNTTQIFNACSEFMVRTNYQTQIIILEHAPKETWKDISNINLVEEWRGDIDSDSTNFNALIQQDWL